MTYETEKAEAISGMAPVVTGSNYKVDSHGGNRK